MVFSFCSSERRKFMASWRYLLTTQKYRKDERLKLKKKINMIPDPFGINHFPSLKIIVLVNWTPTHVFQQGEICFMQSRARK